MIIVEQGKVVDLCAEPGEYVYDCKTEPSIFSGDLSAGIKTVFQQIGVLRNVEPPTRPRLECLRETGLILRCDRKVGLRKSRRLLRLLFLWLSDGLSPHTIRQEGSCRIAFGLARSAGFVWARSIRGQSAVWPNSR